MKITVYNDIHLFSKYNDDPSLKGLLDKESADGSVILNGDIVDCSACKKKDAAKARAYQKSLMIKFDDYYIKGNHDLLPYWYDKLIIGKTLFTHGHLIGKPERVAKWKKYEHKSPGAGFLKQIWVGIADDADWLKGLRPLPEDVIDKAVKLALDHGCVEVVLGHYHPLKELRYKQKGVTIRCLPKGRNEIEIVGD